MTLQVGDLIPIGGSGNVKKSEVLEGKTYSSDEGVELVGEMPDNGVLSKTITTQGGSQKIEEGYYEGGEIKAQFANLTPSNIKKGVNVGGVVGTLRNVNNEGTLTIPPNGRESKSFTVPSGSYVVYVYRRYDNYPGQVRKVVTTDAWQEGTSNFYISSMDDKTFKFVANIRNDSSSNREVVEFYWF